MPNNKSSSQTQHELMRTASVATSLESMATRLAGDRSDTTISPQVAISEMATLLARSSDTESGAIAALVVLRRATGSREARVEIRYQGTLRTVWTDSGTRGIGSELIDSFHTTPLTTAGEQFGALILDSPTLANSELTELSAVAADLFSVAASRDMRMRQLELEVHSQVRLLAEQREFMERIVDSLPFGLHVVDRDYRIHAWNHRREVGMLGVSRDDAIGRTVFEVLSRQPRDLIRSEFDEVFATGKMQQFQMESSATGERRTFRISKIPMSLGADDVTHVITVGEDITDWKAALDRIAQSEKLAALGQLAAGVMHELNNPLATIAACAESISLGSELGKAGGATANPEQWVRIIEMEVQRCRKIVDGLLDFSRPKPVSREVVDCNDCLQRALFLLQHHPRYKRATIDTKLHEAPLYIKGDVDQLIQAVIALAMNAFDVTPPGGRVAFRTATTIGEDGSPNALIEVEDEGPGISHSLAHKIFEPFFTTKPQGQGTGLGLSICYGIVSDHGGTFELVQPDVKGATFRISLPIVQRDLQRSTK